LSILIDTAAECRLVKPLAIHLLRLDLLGDRVHEFVGLPEAWILLGEVDALFDEGLAVRILVVDLVGADARGGCAASAAGSVPESDGWDKGRHS
jgi:hypothetical protein